MTANDAEQSSRGMCQLMRVSGPCLRQEWYQSGPASAWHLHELQPSGLSQPGIPSDVVTSASPRQSRIWLWRHVKRHGAPFRRRSLDKILVDKDNITGRVLQGCRGWIARHAEAAFSGVKLFLLCIRIDSDAFEVESQRGPCKL